MQYRSRTVVTQPSPGQPACGALESSQPCNEQKCSTCLQGHVPATRTDAKRGVGVVVAVTVVQPRQRRSSSRLSCKA